MTTFPVELKKHQRKEEQNGKNNVRQMCSGQTWREEEGRERCHALGKRRRWCETWKRGPARERDMSESLGSFIIIFRWAEKNLRKAKAHTWQKRKNGRNKSSRGGGLKKKKKVNTQEEKAWRYH